MVSQKGYVCATFGEKSKYEKMKKLNLLGCIILAKEITKRPQVLESVISRKNFFARTKKDMVLFNSFERQSRACNFNNLMSYEHDFGVRIFIWRKVGQYDIKEVYCSASTNLYHCRVNILSFSNDDHDLR